MRVNVYAEELTDKVSIETKTTADGEFTGLRFWLELPVTREDNGALVQHQGPFIHRPGDDDSAAVTFWGKRNLRSVLQSGLQLLERHYVDLGEPATKWGNRCFLRAADNEPIFVLRAQDMTAPAVIRDWINRNPQLFLASRQDAERIAMQMLEWPKRKMAD